MGEVFSCWFGPGAHFGVTPLPTISRAAPPVRVPSTGSHTQSRSDPELAHTPRQHHTGSQPQPLKSPANGVALALARRPRPPSARSRLARRAPLGRNPGPATLTLRSPSHGRPPPPPRRPAAAPQSWPWCPSACSTTLVVVFAAVATTTTTTAAPEAGEHREAPPTRPAPARGARWKPRPRLPAPNTPHPQHAAKAPPTAFAGCPTHASRLPPILRPTPETPPTCPTHTTEVPPQAPPTQASGLWPRPYTRLTPAACARGVTHAPALSLREPEAGRLRVLRPT